MTISKPPWMEFVGKADGGAFVTCCLHFADHEGAVEFSDILVDFIQRKMPKPPASHVGEQAQREDKT